MQASLSLFLRWMPLLLMLSSVVARDLSTGSSSGRSLLLASCPASCQKCISQGTSGGKKCKTCYNSLVVLRSSDSTIDGACGCPAGTYVTGSGASADCVPCTKGKWCPGGTLAASTETSCPNNMITLAAGSKRISACVNNPGYKFVPGTSNAAPSATLCPPNTYSPGLKQQQKCRACPSGFVTNPAGDNAVRTTIASCYAPPGYYVNAAGVAVACPKGEWKAGYNTLPSCTRCPTGVTTEGPAKTSAADCNTLRPGFQGMLADVTAGIASTSLCPRSKICTGVKLTTADAVNAQGAADCLHGLWTQGQGSISASQCQVAPGYTVDTNGDMTPCDAGSYREGWTMPDGNTGCVPCGTNIGTDVNAAPIAFYAADGSLIESLPAATSAESCYIEPGNGIYKKADGSFVARSCNSGSEYGASTRQYGLIAAPCRQCPLNMVVGAMANDANADAFAAGLAISPDACVTQAGYGYDTRTSQLCEKGTYAGGLTRDPCTPCPVGKTTAAEGKSSINDCIGEAGLGADGMPCPIGTYSTGGGSCTTCNPAGLSTAAEGSTSAADCNVCAAGFSPVVAGTCSQCGAGLYSPGGMPASDALACSTCPTTTFALQGSDMSDTDVFLTVAGMTTAGARSASDCVASLAQLTPQLGPINVAAGALTAKADATTAADCAAACTADAACQFVNIQYNADGSIDCKVKLSATEGPTTEGWTLFGVKQVPAGDVGALSKPTAKSVGNGLFTWWADPAILAEATGLTGVTAQTGLTTSAACQDACTMSNACAGVVLVYTTGTPEPACNHVVPPAAAAGSADSNKRTLLKAVPTRTDGEALIQAAG